MEELRKKYEKVRFHLLPGLYFKATGEEKIIIGQILREKGIEMEEDDEHEMSSTNTKEVSSTKKTTSKSKMPDSNSKQNDMMDSEASKKLQFYMVYSGFMNEYGGDVAMLAAIFASYQDLMSKTKKTDADGYFFLEHPKIQRMTGISIYRQKIAIKILVDLQIIYIGDKRKLTPPKKFYRVDTKKYLKIADLAGK